MNYASVRSISDVQRHCFPTGILDPIHVRLTLFFYTFFHVGVKL